MRSLILVSVALTCVLATAPYSTAASTKVGKNTVLKCTGIWPFKAGVLQRPNNAEENKTATAALLRRTLRDRSHKNLPRTGWFVTFNGKQGDLNIVQYANGTIDGVTGITYTQTIGKKRWKQSRTTRGFGCAPRQLTRSGSAARPWYPVSDELPIDPTARSVAVAVDVQSCDPTNEVYVDAITYTKKAVRIRIDVRPNYNAGSCIQTLKAPTKYVVALTEPIGKRAIVDTARVLPQTRATAKQLAAVRAGANPFDVLLFFKSKKAFCDDEDPSAYLTTPTKDQLRRWNERAEKDCAWAADGAPEYPIWS